jgi:hypothetical protein
MKAGTLMVRLLTAYTREVDDSAKAIKEIHEQLNLAEKQLTHSAILLFCYSEFIKSGVAEAVGNSLPAETVGCTSHYFALPGAAGDIMLTVMALTSDDVEFAAGVSEPLTGENLEGCIDALYQKTAASLNAEPAFIFALLPMLFNLGSDIMLTALDHACGGIPVFGTGALDMHIRPRHPKTIYRGSAYSDRMVLLLFKGPIKPKFFFFPFPEQGMFSQDAVITGAEGNQITDINNMPAISFVKELGLFQESKHSVSIAFPLVVDYHDGTDPQVVVMYSISPEGALICGTHVQVGGTLKIGVINADYVLASARDMIQAVKKTGNQAGFLMFSCFLRSVVLRGNSLAEIELFQKEIGGFSSPYLFLYSGGEICPRYMESGETVNRFYQFALIACQF